MIKPSMQALPDGYRALVIGASGAIGAALLEGLQADPRCALALGLHCRSDPALDLLDEAGVAAAAELPNVIDGAAPEHGGGFFSDAAEALPW